MRDHEDPRHSGPMRALVALAAVCCLLAGCSVLGSDAEAPLGGSGGALESRSGAGQDAMTPEFGGDGRAVGTTTAGTLLDRDVIQRATLSVRSRDLASALQQVRAIVAGAQGVVADEATLTRRDGEPRRSSLTLRVPADAFDSTLADLAGLGRVAVQRVSTEDVSTEVVDVEARIVSAERTLRRIRQLLDEADSFADVLSLESELARREADLASLQAQQAYLQDQTSLSTISLTLLPPRPEREPADTDPAGFVAGLQVGWDALAGLVTVLLTALGVVVPLLLVLVPLAALVWWPLRRLVRRGAGAPAAEPGQPPVS
jgi:hypothetical protein